MWWVRFVNSIYERQHLLLSSGILDDIIALDPRWSPGIRPGSMGRQPRIAPCFTGWSSDVTARDIQSWLLQRCHLAEHLADRSGASGSLRGFVVPYSVWISKFYFRFSSLLSWFASEVAKVKGYLSKKIIYFSWSLHIVPTKDLFSKSMFSERLSKLSQIISFSCLLE